MKGQGFIDRGKMFALVVALLIGAFAMQPVAEAQIAAGSVRDASGAFIKEVTFYASGARTGPGNTGTPVDISAYDSAAVLINVTAAGTTLTVNFDNCIDAAGTKCGVHTASAAITTTGLYMIKASNTARYARLSFTSTGSFTFEAVGVFKPST